MSFFMLRQIFFLLFIFELPIEFPFLFKEQGLTYISFFTSSFLNDERLMRSGSDMRLCESVMFDSLGEKRRESRSNSKTMNKNRTKQFIQLKKKHNISNLKCKISELTEVRSSDWIINGIRCYKMSVNAVDIQFSVSSIYAIDEIKIEWKKQDTDCYWNYGHNRRLLFQNMN